MIPPRRTHPLVACPLWGYTNRNRVENLCTLLKDGDAVDIYHRKTDCSRLGMLYLASTDDWLKSINQTA